MKDAAWFAERTAFEEKPENRIEVPVVTRTGHLLSAIRSGESRQVTRIQLFEQFGMSSKQLQVRCGSRRKLRSAT